MTNNKNITHYLSTIDKSDFHYIKNLIWVKDNKMENICVKSCFYGIIKLIKKEVENNIRD